MYDEREGIENQLVFCELSHPHMCELYTIENQQAVICPTR
jgi:hypothetical protein